MISPLRFSSKIRLVSRQAFHQLPLQEMRSQREYAPSPWFIGDRVVSKPRGYTDGAYVCNVGGFHNGKKLVLFHLIPYAALHDFERKVRPALKQDLKQLLQEGAPVRGFLSGGDPIESSSGKLFNQLKNLFEEMGIPFSVLWGQETGGPLDVYYSAREDTWIVHAESMAQEVLTLDDIKANFRHRYLDPGDTLEAGGRTYRAHEISPTLTPQAKQKKGRFRPF